MRAAAVLLAPLILASCSRGDNIIPTDPPDGSITSRPDAAIDAAIDAPAPDASDPFAPTRLAETGLYVDFDNLVIASGVTEFEPQFALWTDGASKRRWILLPEGATIDSSDMDFWDFPEGTKLWKEFSRDGLRIETRLYWKQGPDASDWEPFTFVWNAEQDDAVAEAFGIPNALGTNHDVPTLFDCVICHDNVPNRVIGYSAIQLDGAIGGHNLADLVAAGTLTDNPVGAGPVFFPLPGAAVDQAAMGYLHGNCGGCHWAGSEVQDVVPLDLRLVPGQMATVAETGTYQTTVGVVPTLMITGATAIIEPGDPAASALRIRMNTAENARMPPLGTEDVDTDAVTAIDAWINVVPPP